MRPVGLRGVVAVEVRVAEPTGAVDQPQRAQLSLLTEYGAMQRFARDVERLAAGEVAEAVLRADATLP